MGIENFANWVDTLLPLIIPGLFGNIMMIFFLRQYLHSVPDSLHQIATWQTGAFQMTDMMEAFVAKGEKRTPVYQDLPPAPSIA